jgi:hypothetical protein
MADTIKISALGEIASGALDNNSVVPVVDGGTTYKLPISKLKDFIATTFATDSELSSQISIVNSTISGLDTDDISEGSNLYYTNARVTNQVNSLGVISGSAAALRTFLNVEDGADVTDDNSVVAALVSATGISAGDKTTIKSNLEIGEGGTDLGGTGTVSSSAQISDFNTFVENSVTSSMTVLSASYAISASYAENAGGGGGNDYISNVSISGTSLTFTGLGSAFNASVNLSDGDVLTLDDGDAVYVDYNSYQIDSSSIEQRLSSGGGGGASIPDGTVSSSIQVLGGSTVISSSNQIAELGVGIISSSGQIDFSEISSDDISEGVQNQYYSESRVEDFLDSKQVVSGSQSGDWNTLANKPFDIVSSSAQVGEFGYITISTQNDLSESIATRFNNIDGLDPDSTNIFTAEQRFAGGIKLTGSIEIQPDGGLSYFSGSGLGLTNIQAANVVGSLPTTEITSNDLEVSIDNISSRITINASNTGSVRVTAGNGFELTTGSFSGSGALLNSIPPSAIVGGVGGSGNEVFIGTGSFTASVDEAGFFRVRHGLLPEGISSITSEFSGSVKVSGSIVAEEISVGTAGTPTLYSSTNLNLSASNAVIVTDSPLRLSPQTDTTTGSFTLSNGDIVYSDTSNDFYGYKNGSWISLTQAGDTVIEGQALPDGLISGSSQIAALGAGIVSSSTQIVASNDIQNTEVLFVANSDITSSTSLTYNVGTDTLSTNNLSYTGTFTGLAGSTGSFGRLLGDSIRINNAVELPNSDGSANQVLKTDGNGNVTFATVETLITSQNITTDGIITVGSGSVIGTGSISLDDTLTVNGEINGNTLNSTNFDVGAGSINLRSNAALIITSSTYVEIDDILVLKPRTTNPSNPESGSIISSGSGVTIKPYFWDGNQWNALY